MLALACAGLFAVTASAAPAGETAAPMSPQDANPYITFSSSLKFYVYPQVVSPGGEALLLHQREELESAHLRQHGSGARLVRSL